jgi:hypothetical protein
LRSSNVFCSQVQAYAIDPATGAPAHSACAGLVPCVRARALHEIADVAVAPDGKGVYTAANRFLVTDETDIEGIVTSSALGVFPASTLRQLAGPRGCPLFAAQGRVANPGCSRARPPFLGATSIAITPDGRQALASFGYTGAIVLLDRNRTTQALTPVAGRRGCVVDPPVSRAFARACSLGRGIGFTNDVVIAPDGRHAYAVNQDGLAVLPLR